MGILANLGKTNLKSLRYGRDRIGGGSSNQPYITKPIPNGEQSLGNTGGPDFLLRGGTLAITNTADDVSRLTKMFFDTKSFNGFGFIAKQNLLSRTGVKTQAGGQEIYLPTNTLAQAGVNAFGLHFYKQGLNPIPIPSNGNIIPLGPLGAISSTGNIISYSQIVKNSQTSDKNRLFQLYDVKILNNKTSYTGNSVSPLSNNILQYGGGPGSILGIGNTNISFSDQRTGANSVNLINDGFFSRSLGKYIFNFKTYQNKFNVNPNEEQKSTATLTLGSSNINLAFAVADGRIFSGVTSMYNVSIPYTDNDNKIQDIRDSSDVFNTQTYNVPIKGNNNVLTLDTEQIRQEGLVNKTRGSYLYTPVVKDFRSILRVNLNENSSIISNAPNYNTENIENRVHLGNPGAPGNIYSYTKGKIILGGGDKSSALDKVNAKFLYQSELVDPNETNDLVKFRIEAIDNDTPSQTVFIHFRAFLDSFSDAYNASWNPTRFSGRGEEFYTYNGFTRSISINWTVAAQSKDELIPMYQKLNYLASNLTPDYSKNGYMRGPMMRLTVGGYLYSQPGFITSLTYTIDDSTPWEIGINDGVDNANIDTSGGITSISDPQVKELAHIIKVTMNYTPIHTFTPRKQENKYQNPNGALSEFGKEQFIALSTGVNNNNYSGDYSYIK